MENARSRCDSQDSASILDADTRGAFLEEWWLLASKHVVHMGRDHFPTTPVEWPSADTSFTGLYSVAMECHGALSDFADAYRAESDPLAEDIDDLTTGTRPMTLDELRDLRGGKPCPFQPVHPVW